MRLSAILRILALAAALPSIHAITCAVGSFIPNAAGQIENTGNGIIVAAFTCPTEATGCVTVFMRQGFNTETPRLVIVSCQTEQACVSSSEVVAPNHWYDIRCCTSNNCNREGLNNIDWSDRVPTGDNGGLPTFSIPTFSLPTDIPTDGPTSDPTTPTQAAGTQPPVGTIRCRQGTATLTNNQIPADTSSWQSSTCQSGQTFCVTFFERTDDKKFIMGNCADTCISSVLVTTPTRWLETTCCTGDNCNNDINQLSTHDWGERSMNATASPIATSPPATPAPTGSSPTTTTSSTGSSPTTTSPTSASPITGSTGTTSRPTVSTTTSTGINNIAFTSAVFSPLLMFILAIASFVMSF